MIGRGLRVHRSVFGLLLALAGSTSTLGAQSVISVPFTSGFVGTRSSSAGTANNVLTYATLGIARTFFIQSSSTTTFELQGNDIPGTLRIMRVDGTTLDIPASANWRNSGGTTFLIGILPRPQSPISFVYAGGSIQITDGSASGGSSVGGYVAAYAGSSLADGSSTSGNAAQSQVLSGLNSYLSTVLTSRPAGPVTVNALTTSSTTPTVTGTATLLAGETLSAVIGGIQYSTGSTPAIVAGSGSWSLSLATPVAVGTHEVSATITNADGFTLTDATSNELTVVVPGGTLTVGGSFTANDKTYDGTAAATGAVGGLTLAGVSGGHDVTIASVTIGFQTAAAGSGKTVSISGVTLGGANAASYSVSVAGAPTATASITAKTLTIAGVTAADKTYDGTTAALLVGTPSYVGLASGQTFGVSGTPVASFTTASVGVSKAITVVGYTPPSANYTTTQPTGLTASVTAKSLGIGGSFTAADKEYDGSTEATITSTSLTPVGRVGSDDVWISCVMAAFADSAVGAGKPVSLVAAMTAGDASGNYAVTTAGAPTTTASITAVVTPPSGGTVTIGGSFTANDKTYDGTVSATGTTSALTLVGVNAPDQVTIASVSLAFESAAAGSGRTAIITGVTLAGTDAGTYSVSLAGAPTTTANIMPKTLTIGGTFTATDKEYDGARAATITMNRLVPLGAVRDGEVVIGGATATFADATVGAAITVSLTGVTLAGPAAGNYILSMIGMPTTSARITPRGLTIGGAFTVADKRFDGTTAATITSSSLTPLGVRAGDVVSLDGLVATFADAAVGTSKPVALAAARLVGAASPNYTLTLAGSPRTAAAITTAPPPSAPRNVAAAAGDGSITVTWALPELEGCSAVTGYYVEYSTNAGTTWSRVTLASRAPTAAELQRLMNNAPHRVRVAAFNACGTSGFTDAAGTTMPMGPTMTATGSPISNAPGTITVNSGGVLRPVTVEIVQDTTLQLTGGDFTLTVRSRDSAGVAIAADSAHALELDHGGTAAAQGSGFAPGTLVTVYIYSATGAPLRLGQVMVAPDGSFATTLPIPGSLPPGDHTLQVNGIDREFFTRSVTVGVTVAEPPADLVLTAEPDRQSPAVGDTIVITITVTNKGAGRAMDVVIPRAFAEPGFQVLTAAALEGAYDIATQTWTIPRVDPGARARMRLTVVVVPPAPQGITP